MSAIVRDAEIRASTALLDQAKALMLKANPAAARGALVTAKELRRVSGMPKTAFDALMVAAMKTGQIVGHKHDYVSSLSDADRDALVNDPRAENYGHSGSKFRGAFYVGFAIRQ